MNISNLGDQVQMLDIVPVASITTTTLSSAIDLQPYEGEMAAVIDVNAVQGTLPTLNCKLQHADTSVGSYTDVPSGAFTQLTTVSGAQKISLNSDQIKRFVKLDMVVGGTDTPTFIVSGKLFAIKKNPA